MAMGITVVVLCATPFTCLAGQPTSVSPAELDRSIEETLERREFAWRMPRERVRKEKKKQKARLQRQSNGCWSARQGHPDPREMDHPIFRMAGKFAAKADKKSVSSNKSWITPVRVVLILLLLLLLAVLTLVFFRIWRRHYTGTIEVAAAVVAPLPDLNDEDTKADDLPANRWLVAGRRVYRKRRVTSGHACAISGNAGVSGRAPNDYHRNI